MNARTTTCLALALALTLALAVSADDPPQEDFQALEESLLQALRDGDAEALNRLIDPQFGYYLALPDRPMQGLGAEKWRQAALGLVPLESFEIHESHARPIGDQVMMTATRATLTRGDRKAQRLLTSTWLRDADGAWKVVARIDVELGGAAGGTERAAASPNMSDEERAALRAAFRERMGEGADREARMKAFREQMRDEEKRKAFIEEFRARRAESQPSDESAGDESAEDEPPPG